MKELAVKLKCKGIKVTPQRLSIYNMLSETNEHPSAETIYKKLEVTHPSMSLATVYKTLNTLRDVGLIQALNVREDGYRYDANNNPHSHMVCEVCHRIYDLSSAPLIENLIDELQAQTDFIIMSGQLNFYGVCRECQ